MTIKKKLTAILILTSTAAMLISCFAFVVFDISAMRRALVSDLTVQAQVIASNAQGALAFGVPEDAREILSALWAKSSIITARIYTADGEPFAGYKRSDISEPIAPPPSLENGYMFGDGRLHIIHPIKLGDSRIGSVYLCSDMQQIADALKYDLIIVLLVIVIGAFAAFLIAIQLQKVISRPILSLTETARTVSEQKNYSVRAIPSTNDEMGLLMNAFNSMLDQIQERDRALIAAGERAESRADEAEKARRELEREIAERIRSDEALQQSEERFRRMADNIQDGLLIIENDRIVYANNRASSILGYSREELIRLDRLELAAPEERERLKLINNEMNETGIPPRELEYWITRKDGTRRCINNRYSVCRVDGRTTGRYVVISDITEHKQAEEEKKKIYAQLLQAQKMEAVGILAGGVAHDFNNLLTTIQGYVEMGMMELDESHPLYSKLSQVQRAAVRAAALTRQLLLFSRKQPMEPTLININATIENMYKMLTRLIGENINFSTRLVPDLWTVRADAGNMEQVIMNLVVNARDAMPQGGELTISSENVHITPEQCRSIPDARPGTYICVSFSDTGIGMDSATAERIFEPFFSTKDSGSGTGLGLAVVYGIVKQHGGWISVESEPSSGTKFNMYLPAVFVPPQESRKKPLSDETLLGSSEHILLVEDQKEVRLFCAEALRRHNYIVHDAADAGEALALFDKHGDRIRLILSDVVLPDRNGLDLVENIRSKHPAVKAILCSGYTDEKSQRTIIQEKKYRYMQKPYTIAELLKTIRTVLQKSTPHLM